MNNELPRGGTSAGLDGVVSKRTIVLSRVVARVVASLLVALMAFAACNCRSKSTGPSITFGPKEIEATKALFTRAPKDLREFWAVLSEKSTVPGLRTFAADQARIATPDVTGSRQPGSIDPARQPDQVLLYRLLGTYAQLRYESEMIALLGRLVSLPTFKAGDRPQHNNPAIVAMGELLQTEAARSGLTFRNVDNRIFEFILPGSGPLDLGIYTHGDVVPAIAELWRLADGERIDPFRLRIMGEKLYGRGTEDDKCSIVSALFALRVIQEANLPVRRSIRLMVETTEETGGDGMEYYKARHPLPQYNVVLDSSYPVVTAEKGYGVVRARFREIPLGEDPSKRTDQNVIVDIEGGAAVNQIPARSVVRLQTQKPADLANRIRRLGRKLDKSGRIKLEAGERDNEVLIQIVGESAHASQPERGANPVSHALVFLAKHRKSLNLANNAYLRAAVFVSDNFGTDDYGRTLGLDFKDDFMGSFTAVVTQAVRKGDAVEVGVNLRLPRGKTRDEVVASIKNRLGEYATRQVAEVGGVPFDLEVTLEEPMVRDPNRIWIQTLLGIYGDVTGRPSQAVASSGATTARQLPNGVNFGPSRPEEKYRGHTALEYKNRSDFLMDVQLFTEMILRLGNLETME